ncbi:hypothetical protein T484DRAFT_1968248 [Baffinella frigidus]|nr:hypothetical protein T484DRAFT_1968248 [Cryptophyta sp. CCMP2293]
MARHSSPGSLIIACCCIASFISAVGSTAQYPHAAACGGLAFAGTPGVSGQLRTRLPRFWMGVNGRRDAASVGHSSGLGRGQGVATCSRASLLRALPAALSLAVLSSRGRPVEAVGASSRGLRRALVNVVRLETGLEVLREVLAAKQYDGLQAGIKILFRDTAPGVSMGTAAKALPELGLPQRAGKAEELARRTEYVMAQTVEWDGWDKVDARWDMNERFQAIDAEKADFDTKGLAAASLAVTQFLALFPSEAVAEARDIYADVYAPILNRAPPKGRGGAGRGEEEDGGGGGDEGGGMVSF